MITAQQVRSRSRSRSPGGIDLNARNIQTTVTKQGAGAQVKFDPAQIARFKSGDFSGVRPVILKIEEIPSILPLLGMAS